MINPVDTKLIDKDARTTENSNEEANTITDQGLIIDNISCQKSTNNVVCFVFLYNFLVKFCEPYLEEELDETQRSVKLGELTSFGSSLEAVTQFDPQATMGMQFIILICFNCCQLESVKLICWW